MFPSFIVYSLTMIIMLLLTLSMRRRKYFFHRKVDANTGKITRRLVVNSRFLVPQIIGGVLVFTCVFGLRYNVGIDYENYLYDLRHDDVERYEFIFRGVSRLFIDFELPEWLFFSIWTFLQLFFFLYAFKDEKRLYPYLVFVLFCGQYFLLWMNVIRQDLAACIFMSLVPLLLKKKYVSYILLTIFSFGIHQSAILFSAILPIINRLRKIISVPVYAQLSLLFISIIAFAKNFNPLEGVDELLNVYLMGTSMERYGHGAIENTTVENVFGGTAMLGFVLDGFIIFFSPQMKKYYKSDKFNICYILYFTGAILGYLLGFSYLLLRPLRYVRFFKLIVSGYLLYYLNHSTKYNKLLCYLCIFMYLLLYIAIFFFDKESGYQYHFYFLK